MDPGTASMIAGAASNMQNNVLGAVFNTLNYMQQKEQFNYMKQMQQESWLREDTAVQRRVADLKAAGLSPTLAAGNSATSSSPVHVTAPQHQGFQVANMADVINAAVGVKQAMVQMRKTVAEEQKTNAETVGVNLNNQIAKVAADNAQVKFDLQKMQMAEVQRRLGLIDAQTANTIQDTALRKINTKINEHDYDLFSRGINLPMSHGTSGVLGDVMRAGSFSAQHLEDTARYLFNGAKNLFKRK